MFKNKLLISLLLVLPLFLLFPYKTEAAQFEIGKDFTLEEEVTLQDDLYVEGSRVSIDGVLDGDLFVAGEAVYISGTITGDVYALGNVVDITGDVYGSIVTVGNNVSLINTVGRNAYVFASYASLNSDITNDLFLASINSSISGKVYGDARVFSGQTAIDSDINQDLIVSASSIQIDEDLVSGELHKIAQGDSVTGIQKISLSKNSTKLLSTTTMISLLTFVGMYVIGSAMIYFIPVKSQGIVKKISTSPKEFLNSFLVGLAVLILIPFPLLILMITVIGFPIAILIVGLLVFAMYFGKLWVEMAFGKIILNIFGEDDKQYYLSLLTGRFVTILVNLIPFVRGLYGITLTTTAVGAIVRLKYDQVKEAKKLEKKSVKK